MFFHFTFTYMLIQYLEPIYNFCRGQVEDHSYYHMFDRAVADYLPRDARTDVLIPKILIAALLGYLGMGLFCTFLDLILIHCNLRHVKKQGEKSFFTISEWLLAVRVSLRNIVLLNWVVSLPILHLWRTLYGIENMLGEDDEWNWQRELPRFAICVVVIETVFYWTHWLLHFPYLYKRIHKMHHTFTAPIAVAAPYAHPIEFLFGNLAGVILGLALANPHPWTAYYWVCYAIVTTCGSHSGYECFGCRGHDLHHEKFTVNFGVAKITDILMGTDYESSDFYKKDMQTKTE